MVKKNKFNILDSTIKPLIYMLAIILAIIFLFLLFQIYFGYLRNPLDRFPGVSGRFGIGRASLTVPQHKLETERWVKDVKKKLRKHNFKTLKEVKKFLENQYGPYNDKLISFFIKSNNNYKKGDLFYVVSDDIASDQCQYVSNPYCFKEEHYIPGNNYLYDKTPDGLLYVQEYIKIANSGGGWYGAFFVNNEKTIIEKYTYIIAIPEFDLLIAANYYPNNNMIHTHKQHNHQHDFGRLI